MHTTRRENLIDTLTAAYSASELFDMMRAAERGSARREALREAYDYAASREHRR